MLTYIPFRKAFEVVTGETPVLGEEKVPFMSSLGRVLSRDIVSEFDFPPHPTSAVDGFALPSVPRAGDSFEVTGQSLTGTPPQDFRKGAIKVSTGAFIPEWAKCVVMKEHVELAGRVRVLKGYREGQNINARGSVFEKGEVMVKRGTYVDAGILELISASNNPWVFVFRKPTVHVFATGNEVSDPGESGSIYNASAVAAIGAAKECGAEVSYGGIVKDDQEEIRRAIRNGRNADVIVSTGGVSVGEVDHVLEAVEDEGFEVLFWKVKQKPGKPLLFAKRGNQLFLGLPGYPSSAATNAEIYLKAVLRKMQGIDPIYTTTAVSSGDYSRRPRERHEFARAWLFFDGALKFRILENQLSANPRNFAYSNGLVILPPEVERLSSGEKFKVIPKWGLRKAVVYEPVQVNERKAEDRF